jgi:glycolate oxidase FAD binding subunit
LREFEHPFFAAPGTIWRLAVRSGHPPLAELDGHWLIDWGGAQRWLRTEAPAERVRALAKGAGGHASTFRDGAREDDVFEPLDPVLMRLHRNLKRAMDPLGLLNPGRLYREL